MRTRYWSDEEPVQADNGASNPLVLGVASWIGIATLSLGAVLLTT